MNFVSCTIKHTEPGISTMIAGDLSEGARVDPRHPGLQSTFHYNGVKGRPACVPTHLGRSACQRSRGIPRHPAASRGIARDLDDDRRGSQGGVAGDLDDDRRGHIQGSTGISTGRRGSRGGSQGTVGDSRVVDSCSSSASMHLDLGRSACQRSRDVPGFSRPSIITASRGGGAPGLRAYAPRA